MKYKDWLKQQEQEKYPDPSKGIPIYCPDCGKLIGYDRDYMFVVLNSPIVCPDCDEIIIMPNNITYTTYTYGTSTTSSSIQHITNSKKEERDM